MSLLAMQKLPSSWACRLFAHTISRLLSSFPHTRTPPPIPPPRAQSLATVCDLLTLLKVGSGLASTVNNPYASLLTGGSSASNTALIKLLE